MSDLTNNEREELERYREKEKVRKEKAKKTYGYRNKFSKENYKRFVCLYPINEAQTVDELLKKENMTVSSYILNLIRKDLKERGLI